MSPVEEYLAELAASLRVRGRARRRLLRECRDHLRDASAAVGEAEAVRRFGPAADVARAFDVEVAVRRGRWSTVGAGVGVLAVGASTVALVDSATSPAGPVVLWAVVFFGAAQVAAVCLVLALLQAVAMQRDPADAASVALLCRRNVGALAFAVLTLVAAAGAVPGTGSAVLLLAGPVLALGAMVAVTRTWRLARRVDGRAGRAVRSPVADAAAVLHLRVPATSTPWLLPVATLVAAVGAFAWDHADQGTTRSSVVAMIVEVALLLGGYLVLGPALGLRPGRVRGAATGDVSRRPSP